MNRAHCNHPAIGDAEPNLIRQHPAVPNDPNSLSAKLSGKDGDTTTS